MTSKQVPKIHQQPRALDKQQAHEDLETQVTSLAESKNFQQSFILGALQKHQERKPNELIDRATRTMLARSMKQIQTKTYGDL